MPEIKKRGLPKSSLICFSFEKPSNRELSENLNDKTTYIYRDKSNLYLHSITQCKPLIALQELPNLSFIENWIAIVAALHTLELPLGPILQQAQRSTLPDHRLSKIAMINDIVFFNDSKSTTPISTLAAVTSLQGAPIHLFLGGLGKGIDRAPLIQQLQEKIHHIYCFGKEAKQLATLCNEQNTAHSEHATLEEAFSSCMQNIKSGDYVLFSPSGSSFDLFENYEQRGNRFVALVEQFAKMQKN